MKKITFLFIAVLALCWQGNAQDTCATATPVTEGTVTGTTITQGTLSADMTLPSGDDAAWFAYTATADGTINVNACGGGADTDLAIGTGVCGALTDIAVNDDSCDLGTGDAWASEIDGYAVVAGEVYYIEWSDEWSEGPFDWSLTFTPAPLCAAPVTGAVTVDDTGCDVDGTFLVNIEVTDAGDAGSVFDDGTTTEPIVTGIVTMGPYNSGDLVTIDIVALDPACSSNLLTDATYTCPQPQDTCDTAESITPGSYTTTISQGTGSGIMGGVSRDAAFFIYTPAEDGSIYVNSCNNGGNADTNLYIGTGPCNDLTIAEENDDSCDRGDGSAWASEITMPVTAGTAYTIEWDIRYTSGANEFTWTLEFIPPPACEAAAFDAGTINDSACNPDGTGMWSVDIFVEEVGDGGVFDDGTNQYTVVAGNVNAGPYMNGDTITIEYVASDPACSSTVGAFGYSCPLPPPANDEVAGAIDLPVGDTLCESPVLADNTTATTSVENINTADCTFAGGIPLGDVWYSVTVPSTGEVTVETSTTGEITDTVMTMYRGTSGSLVEVGCADDTNGTFAAIALTAADGISPGDVLLVRVWEYGDNVKGTFNVCAFSPTSLGIDDNTLGAFTYYPNPVNNTLTLNAQNTIEDVTLYNMLGQVVLKATPNAVNSEVDMSALANGAYFVQVTIANTTKTVRVIKQ